ncbi:MAG: hypothetical protein L0Z62_42935 [Gemmataceae bacterium]|nr:hypothetical protein [Gemmataceae bacterium]
MNPVGKILVVLNLVFAVITGGLLVFSYAARTHWRDAAEERARLLDVTRKSAQAYHDLYNLEIQRRKKVESDFDQARINHGKELSKLNTDLAALKQQYDDARKAAAAAELKSEQLTKEAERLRKEVGHLTRVIGEREQQILIAQAESAKFRIEAQTQKQFADVAKGRMQDLLKQLREKEEALARLTTGAGQPTASVRDPNYTRPPPAYVKGVIEKIHDADRKLFQISLGSDVGVRENHTLEIYRLKPRADYLGRLVIIDSHPRYAIGRLIRAATQGPIQEGDEVASDIIRR